METAHGWRKRNKKYNIAGHAHFLTFSCYRRLPLLTNELWRDWLAQAVRKTCDKYQVALWAYVFMPEHVHLLLKPRQAEYALASVEQVLKLSVVRRVLNSLKAQGSPLLARLQVQENCRIGYRFWQKGGGYDLNIWTMKKAIEKADYCHRNPVMRKLVKSAEQWR
jgi:putative transposase